MKTPLGRKAKLYEKGIDDPLAFGFGFLKNLFSEVPIRNDSWTRTTDGDTRLAKGNTVWCVRRA